MRSSVSELVAVLDTSCDTRETTAGKSSCDNCENNQNNYVSTKTKIIMFKRKNT